MSIRGLFDKIKDFFKNIVKISNDATDFRKENPPTRNGGGKAPGHDAQVYRASRKIPLNSRYATVPGNTWHVRNPDRYKSGGIEL